MASTPTTAPQQATAASKPVFAPMLFKDFVFVITGGGTGIGKAVALEAVQLGAKVALCGRRQPPLSDAAIELARYTSQDKIYFETCTCDIY
jgi:NAD(P)-dependent dehydrogenase (short-subunit alcohol dehydrogenase family)